jgi:hypothetical protein
MQPKICQTRAAFAQEAPQGVKIPDFREGRNFKSSFKSHLSGMADSNDIISFLEMVPAVNRGMHSDFID